MSNFKELAELHAYEGVKEDWDQYYGKTDSWPYDYNFKHVFDASLRSAEWGYRQAIKALSSDPLIEDRRLEHEAAFWADWLEDRME